MRIALIIPVFNGLRYTQKALNSLYKVCAIDSIRATVEVVVVDDGSTDGTQEWVQTHYPQVHLMRGSGNLWWSGGINVGVHFAIDELNADYILWWNNDIVPDTDYFRHLEKILIAEKPTTIIGSKIYLDKHRNVVWCMGGFFNPRTGKKTRGGGMEQDSPELSIPIEADWLPGMGTVTHRSVYDAIGFLDEEHFPQYHGDSDFTWRAKKRGFRIKVFPDLTIYNDTSNSGIRHNGDLKHFYDSLTSLKSNYNIRKDILFYKIHAHSFLAYHVLVLKYSRYIGGFLKWKFLSIIGIKRLS